MISLRHPTVLVEFKLKEVYHTFYGIEIIKVNVPYILTKEIMSLHQQFVLFWKQVVTHLSDIMKPSGFFIKFKAMVRNQWKSL